MVQKAWLTLGQRIISLAAVGFFGTSEKNQARVFERRVARSKTILGAVLDSMPAQSLPGMIPSQKLNEKRLAVIHCYDKP
jgi:hypothetical protein